MARFLIDEDMPRSLAAALVTAGHQVLEVRDAGLRGRADDEVFARAQADGRVLITSDLGFSNVLRYPPGSHAGIVVVRVPNEMPVAAVVRVAVAVLGGLEDVDLVGSLVIVEQRRVRIRRSG